MSPSIKSAAYYSSHNWILIFIKNITTSVIQLTSMGTEGMFYESPKILSKVSDG
jgi:hypothetical protein